MIAVNGIGFIIMDYFISKRFKKSLFEVLPIATGILIVVLLLLAQLNHLSWIDYFFTGVICIGIIYIIINKINIKENIPTVEIVLLCVFWITIFAFCRNRMVVHGDELAVWASETKTLYYLDGFCKKGFASVEYGNYYPGMMLFMWWTCHFVPNQFQEGLMYAGYWLLYSIPIISIVFSQRKKGISLIFQFLQTVIFVFVFPSVINTMNYSCMTAELPMTSFFAILLFYLAKEERGGDSFESAICLCISVILCTLKVTGAGYAVALLTFALFTIKEKRRHVLISFGGVLIVLLLWKVYCIVMERSNYFIMNASETIKDVKWYGTRHYLENYLGYLRSYLLSVLEEPIHTSNESFLNPSPIVFIFFIILMFIIEIRNTSVKKIGFFFMLMQLVFSVGMVSVCTFVFKETQYLNPENMIYNITRYALPLYLGFLIWIVLVTLQNKELMIFNKGIINFIICIMLLLCGEWNCVYKNIINSSENNIRATEARTNIFKKYDEIIQSSKGLEDRIIFYYDEKNTILSASDKKILNYILAPRQICFYRKPVQDGQEEIEMIKERFQTDYIYIENAKDRLK